MFPEKQISIIITNYRSAELLGRCLLSLEKAGFFDSAYDKEIILINNDPQEKLEAVLEKIKTENRRLVKIINHRKNIGFGGGANLGARKARGKVLWFLNPDCEIKSGKIEEIISHLNDFGGVLGTRVENLDGSIQEWIAGNEIGFWELIFNNFGIKRSKKIWESDNKKECDWVGGTSFFVETELFLSLGGFDDRFFMYFEDMDFCKRVRNLGERVFFYPGFVVTHVGGGSYLERGIQKEHFYLSQDNYLGKYKPGVSVLIKLLKTIFPKKLL